MFLCHDVLPGPTMTARGSVLLVVVATVGTVASPAAASACGYWFLQDDEQKVSVTFLARSIETIPQSAPPTAEKKTLGWFIHETPRLCQRVRSNKLDVRDGQFLKGGAVHARLAGQTLEFGPRRFEIALQRITDTRSRHDLISDLPYWDVQVTSGDKSVAHGSAMSFAGCSMEGIEHKEAEIRERVACYLILRGGRMPPPATPPSRSERKPVRSRSGSSPAPSAGG